MTLGGLLKHQAYVQDYWFTEVVGHELNRGARALRRGSRLNRVAGCGGQWAIRQPPGTAGCPGRSGGAAVID